MPSVYLPMSMLSLRLIDFGTVASMSSSMLLNPVAETIADSSAGVVLL